MDKGVQPFFKKTNQVINYEDTSPLNSEKEKSNDKPVELFRAVIRQIVTSKKLSYGIVATLKVILNGLSPNLKDKISIFIFKLIRCFFQRISFKLS